MAYQLWYTPHMSESDDGQAAMTQKHLGGELDEFLHDEGDLDEAEAVATKRVIAHQIAVEMARVGITHAELARRMKTSRSAVERLLDPTNPSVTLSTLERAAGAVGKRLAVQLQPLIEDAEDLAAIEASAGEPAIPLEDFASSLRAAGKL